MKWLTWLHIARTHHAEKYIFRLAYVMKRFNYDKGRCDDDIEHQKINNLTAPRVNIFLPSRLHRSGAKTQSGWKKRQLIDQSHYLIMIPICDMRKVVAAKRSAAGDVFTLSIMPCWCLGENVATEIRWKGGKDVTISDYRRLIRFYCGTESYCRRQSL